MEYIIVIGICTLAIFGLKFAFQVKVNSIKRLKEIGYDKELNKITDTLPDNMEVCKQILKIVGNSNTLVQVSEDSENKLTYYSVITNHIIIANIKDTFTRIQTIAHEVLHSVQNRKMLLFNFIFSNIYLLYFVITVLLTIFKVIKMPMIPMVLLIIIGCIFYVIRSFLETDAMTKAPYLAKQYMEESQKLSNEEIDIVMKNYAYINNIGIPLTNFHLIVSVLVKIIMYGIIAAITTI